MYKTYVKRKLGTWSMYILMKYIFFFFFFFFLSINGSISILSAKVFIFLLYMQNPSRAAMHQRRKWDMGFWGFSLFSFSPISNQYIQTNEQVLDFMNINLLTSYIFT